MIKLVTKMSVFLISFIFLVLFSEIVYADGMVWVNAETNYSSYESSYLCYVDQAVDEQHLNGAGGWDSCLNFWITEEYEELTKNTTIVGWDTYAILTRTNTTSCNNSYILIEIYNYDSASWNTICNMTFAGSGLFNTTDSFCDDQWLNSTNPEYFWSDNRRLRVNTTGYQEAGEGCYMRYADASAGYNTTDNMYNCSSGNIFLNFTALQEETEAKLYFNADINFQYQIDDTVADFSYEYRNDNEHYICSDTIDKAINITGIIRYWNSTSYAERYYYFYSAEFDSDDTNNVSLYLFENTTSIEFTVQNQMGLGADDILIKAQRWFIGTDEYKLVAEGESDSSGKFNMNLKYGEWYRFLLERNGVLINSYDPALLNSTSVILQLEDLDTAEYFTYWNQVAWNCNYDNVSRSITCIVDDGSGNMNSIWLKVDRINLENRTQICNDNSTSSSAVLICVLPNVNATFRYDLYGIFGGSQTTYWSLENGIITVSGTLESVYGDTGLLILFMFECVMILIGIWNPVVSIVLAVAGLGFGYLFQLVSMTPDTIGVFVGIIIVGALIVNKLRT